jgi:hypothetical protein
MKTLPEITENRNDVSVTVLVLGLIFKTSSDGDDQKQQ